MGTVHPLAVNEQSPIEPMASAILSLDDGSVWVPSAFVSGAYENVPLCVGAAIGWQPVPEASRIVLVIHGGNPSAPSHEIVAAALSRSGLRALVAGLQSIEAQWDDSEGQG